MLPTSTSRPIAVPALTILLIVGQGATYWLWQKGAITQFNEFYAAFGWPVPDWSAFVFRTWRHWWLVPCVSFAFLVLTVARRAPSTAALSISFLLALISLIAMWYAMYPLHAMQRF